MTSVLTGIAEAKDFAARDNPGKRIVKCTPVCSGRKVTKDITKEAQMVLSCIHRVNGVLGHGTTVTMIVRVLRGSRDKRLLEAGLENLSTYGLMSSYSRTEIREIIAHLKATSLVTCGKNEIVGLTQLASGVLFRGNAVVVTLDEGEMLEKFPQSGSVESDSKLLIALKALRASLAKEEQVPAFVIFSNATLKDMAAKAPETMAQFLTVSGVGKIKAKRYASVFLAEIRKYKREAGG